MENSLLINEQLTMTIKCFGKKKNNLTSLLFQIVCFILTLIKGSSIYVKFFIKLNFSEKKILKISSIFIKTFHLLTSINSPGYIDWLHFK